MAEATGDTAGYRFERKFVSFALGVHEMVALIRLHPALFSEIHHERHVNNIYFDTPSLYNYEANVWGLAERLKCRVRWYGKIFEAVERPVLELKRKQGLLGRKDCFPLSPFTLNDGFDASPIFAGAGLPERLQLYLATLRPTLLNRYKRRYFLSADGDHRLTLDSDLKFHRIGGSANRFGEPIECTRRVILELKYDRGKEKGASRIAGHFPIRLTKSSKYVVGIDALHPW